MEPLLRVVIIWRKDISRIKYEWVKCKWELESNLNDTTEILESTISRLIRSSEVLSYEASVKVIVTFIDFFLIFSGFASYSSNLTNLGYS